jgi:hypothetical protein
LAGGSQFSGVADDTHRQENEPEPQEDLSSSTEDCALQKEKTDSAGYDKGTGEILQIKGNKLNDYGEANICAENHSQHTAGG